MAESLDICMTTDEKMASLSQSPNELTTTN